MEALECLLDWSFWVVGGFSSGFFGLERDFMIAVRSGRYCTCVEFLSDR